MRRHFGITSFGVNTWTAATRATGSSTSTTRTDEDEELYFVHSGRATFELDGERVDAPAGTFVFAAPGVKRTAFAEEPGTTIVAVGGTPGKAYEDSGWELWARSRQALPGGRVRRGRRPRARVVEAHPEYPLLAYNLACCESLAGRTSDAIEHLRLALEGSELARELAAGDSDFDPIREEPAFKELGRLAADAKAEVEQAARVAERVLRVQDDGDQPHLRRGAPTRRGSAARASSSRS